MGLLGGYIILANSRVHQSGDMFMHCSLASESLFRVVLECLQG